jgi:hypothetical protein
MAGSESRRGVSLGLIIRFEIKLLFKICSKMSKFTTQYKLEHEINAAVLTLPVDIIQVLYFHVVSFVHEFRVPSDFVYFLELLLREDLLTAWIVLCV